MEKKFTNIPLKVFISYLILAALVISVGWILYSENVVYSNIENKIALEKNNVIRISKLFSNVYQTESLARKAIQSNSEKDFQDYIVQTDSLQTRIDSLKQVVSGAYQVKLLDSVNILLSEKTQNIIQLKSIKSKATDEISVDNAINNIAKLELSLQKLQLHDFTKNPEKLGSYQRKVLQKYVDYMNSNIPDDSTNTLSKKTTDSILAVSKKLLNDVKRATEQKKESISAQENKLLKNEILISDQLRKVLRIIEGEIIVYANRNNSEKEKSLKKINEIITFAAIIGLLLTVFFSILITSDFSKTQLYKRQLETANLKAENLLKSREQLISTVSHDLKTPLSTIVGYTELLGNSDMNTKQHYYINNIKNSSEYISRLVQDLLDFSQLEAGKIAIEQTYFMLPEIIHQVATNIQSVFSSKAIDLQVVASEKLNKPIIGDPFRLKQILINLVGNAYKFTEKGHIKINSQLDKTEKFILITIEDSGIGIEQTSQKLVFEEFSQANENIEKKYGGTGLGLNISKKMIALLGGELRLKKSSSQGSIFEIKLPLIYAEEKIIKTSTPTPVLIKTTNNDKNIIVVDDDVDLLKLTTEVLKQYQYKVVGFTIAEKAIEHLKEYTFDLVITDIQMPNMDGFLFAKTIQSLADFYKNQPIIAVTGQSDINDIKYKEAGFSTVIKKPFTPQILLKTIDAVFNKQEIPVQEIELSKKDTSQLFSLDSINAFLNHDEVDVKTILTSFVTSTATNLVLLQSYVNENDFEKIKAISHKMIPMFKQIESDEIAALLTNLETNDYSQAEVKSIYEKLQPQISKVIALIEKYIN